MSGCLSFPAPYIHVYYTYPHCVFSCVLSLGSVLVFLGKIAFRIHIKLLHVYTFIIVFISVPCTMASTLLYVYMCQLHAELHACFCPPFYNGSCTSVHVHVSFAQSSCLLQEHYYMFACVHNSILSAFGMLPVPR